MKAVILMFDTLRRDFLPNYNFKIKGMDNFRRLEKYTTKFENFYSGSLPCMPARRDLHTGRLNFLHRSWSPLEPFDDSIFEILKEKGIYSHLITDHQHYWEDGGATYHNRYSSYEFVRGQEGDLWKANLTFKKHEELKKYKLAEVNRQNMIYHDEINRSFMQKEEDFPQVRCFNLGIEFLDKNHNCDNWILQIENFDPHEPFYVPDRFKKMVDEKLIMDENDWPEYNSILDINDNVKIEKWKKNYTALMYMCDEYLGKILDKFDEYNLWEDTMLIVNTDHGFLFGEKEWSGKSVMPVYNELANIPFFIWDPTLQKKGEVRKELAQTPDIAVTLLKYFGIDKTKDMTGKPIQNILENKVNHTELIYGYFGAHINITDGKYTYMRGSSNLQNMPLYEYTLMPTRMRRRFNNNDFQEVELSEPLSFTKGMKVLKTKATAEFYSSYSHGNLLFNLTDDPNQEKNLIDYKKEAELLIKLKEKLKENDAPVAEYSRLGIPVSEEINEEYIIEERKRREEELKRHLQNFYNENIHINLKTLLLNISYKTDKNYIKKLYDFMKKENIFTKEKLIKAYNEIGEYEEIKYLFEVKY